jgi:alkyl hydroperoxide reductase subunit D
MNAIETLRARIPDAARDIKLNLHAVLTSGSLTVEQRWGVAVAAAIAARNPELRDAVLFDARGAAAPGVIADAQAAAVIMSMNNVYYRFRHMVGQPGYSQVPARLRMNRLAQPATSRAELELYSLAVSAINGCEMCIQSHEKVVRESGFTEEQVHDAMRIAATVQAAAVALELGDAASAKSVRSAV